MKSIIGHVLKAYATASPMPFMPGFELGSIISPSIVDSLKKESAIRSEIMLSNQIIREVKETQREMEMEMNDAYSDDMKKLVSENHKSLNKTLEDAMRKKCEKLKKLFDLQVDQLKKVGSGSAISNFNRRIESPVDFGSSKIVYLDRSFDSVNVDSTYINHIKLKKEGKDSASECASSVSAGISHWSSHIASEIHSQVASKTAETAKTHNLDTTLVITSWATHKKVKQLVPMNIISDNLLLAWNDLFPESKIDFSKFIEGEMPSDLETDKNELSVVSEIYLGSCMVGLIHFLKSEGTVEPHPSMEQTTSKDLASLSENCLFASMAGESSIASDYGKKVSKLSSQTGIGVKFDLLCYGYIPTIKPNIVQDSVKKFKHFDPAHFNETVQNQEKISEKEKMIEDNKKRTERQSNVGSVIQNTILGLQKAEQYSAAYQVMDINTFMVAFDDFTKHCKNSDVGVPVGLNVVSFGKKDVIDELGKKYDKRIQGSTIVK